MKSTLAVLLANMGFVLQISGIFLLIPIVASFIFEETNATIALFLTATAFLILGFFANSLCERKSMTFKQSCALIVLVFVLLSLIGSIPYLYIGVSSGDPLLHITDCIFESVSGFTTTGFTIIPDITVLPQSIILYRSLTQFIGGMGIVVVLLAFFYPEAKLREFAKSMGLNQNNHKIKKTFLFIIGVYCIVTALMVLIAYGFGYHDLIALSSIIFSAVSTGGFSPVNDIGGLLTQPPFNVIIPFCMFFAASNLVVLAKLYKKNFREFIDSETTAFLIIAGIATVLVITVFNFPSYDAGFHVLSALSTSGFSYTAVGELNDSLKLFLVALMFIGGASFSTAGGIKIYRFLLVAKSVPKTVAFTIVGKDDKNCKVHLFSKNYSNSEVVQASIMIFLTAIVIFVSAGIVSYYGYQPVNALFDCTSAMCTTGLCTGVVGPSLALELKWLFMFLMLLGRVEIIVFLVAISRTKEKRCRNNHAADVKEKEEEPQETETAEEEAKADEKHDVKREKWKSRFVSFLKTHTL
ncbi:MAG: TrkH family potassium uptake protein [Candidatus Bathyarchaeia archaeon]|jgi:trk system potassium uptake protein TrkH